MSERLKAALKAHQEAVTELEAALNQGMAAYLPPVKAYSVKVEVIGLTEHGNITIPLSMAQAIAG